jgi:hypothetical protein
MAESARWRALARHYLNEGQAYSKSLGLRRARAATSLPGLIGERTLDLMDLAQWDQLAMGVKVSRRDVYRSVWESFFV